MLVSRTWMRTQDELQRTSSTMVERACRTALVTSSLVSRAATSARSSMPRLRKTSLTKRRAVPALEASAGSVVVAPAPEASPCRPGSIIPSWSRVA